VADRAPDGSSEHPYAGGTNLSGAQMSALNRFPDDNPNPVLRVDDDGHVIYANPASGGLLKALGTPVGDRLPAETMARIAAIGLERRSLELVADHWTYEVWPVPIADLRFTNLYGRDVTADRAIVKFPDQNPNPVFRMHRDGRLVYANPASRGLIAGLGLAVGDYLPTWMRDQLLERAAADSAMTHVVESGGRTYALLPVDVPEFGFVNVYGTDVTAARERERLALENERLLRNILPKPIADRLRAREQLIADRFDDVTLLFADIVGFTVLSASMTPSELLRVLNEVFTAFDVLVERAGLDKVKTIGDAYMVVGGMPDATVDHTARVAAVALDLTEAVRRIDTAVRLGIRFRIGIHCGPVIAGVIATKEFIYDIWGDTVNVASRMESLSMPGRIQVTQAVKEWLEGRYVSESRGLVDVKGKGPTPTWFLAGQMLSTGGAQPSAGAGVGARQR
jgi:class 3 adenylate cyclase